MLQLNQERPPTNAEVQLDDMRVERYMTITGYSQVFEAWDAVNGLRRAVKIARPGQDAEEALKVETDLTPTIRSSHILPITQSGHINQPGSSWHERPYIVTPYADGGTLRDHTVTDPESSHFVVKIISDAAHGLSDVHKQGYVHRDV